ncbi:MAG TPA: PepSY-associated TM helix domain-containing protein [Candidatus Acidoferrales bacterium]|nr:PepSY-associated TM helix domain-containing protein [Candidatus Acidoferrales bacterium]
MSPATVAWIARLHGWIGLWGAVLGLVFGVSGFVLNHRAVLKLDLMRYAPTHQRVEVPPAAGASPQALADWLPRALDLPRAKVRIPEEKRRPGAETPPPTAEVARRWTVMLNTPQERINVVYWAGDPLAEVTRERANVFATLARLHTGAGLGAGWILFADTLAGAMIALTLSGVLLWTKLHPGRLLAVGLIGGTTVLGVVLVLSGL